jgi:hypothetical protein
MVFDDGSNEVLQDFTVMEGAHLDPELAAVSFAQNKDQVDALFKAWNAVKDVLKLTLERDFAQGMPLGDGRTLGVDLERGVKASNRNVVIEIAKRYGADVSRPEIDKRKLNALLTRGGQVAMDLNPYIETTSRTLKLEGEIAHEEIPGVHFVDSSTESPVELGEIA